MGDVDAARKLDEAEVGRIFREESGRSVAALIRVFGDIDVAEDAVQTRSPSPCARGLAHDVRASAWRGPESTPANVLSE